MKPERSRNIVSMSSLTSSVDSVRDNRVPTFRSDSELAGASAAPSPPPPPPPPPAAKSSRCDIVLATVEHASAQSLTLATHNRDLRCCRSLWRSSEWGVLYQVSDWKLCREIYLTWSRRNTQFWFQKVSGHFCKLAYFLFVAQHSPPFQHTL